MRHQDIYSKEFFLVGFTMHLFLNLGLFTEGSIVVSSIKSNFM